MDISFRQRKTKLHKLPFSTAHLNFTTAQIVINCTPEICSAALRVLPPALIVNRSNCRRQIQQQGSSVVCLCLFVCRLRSWALQNGWTDRDAVWGTESCGFK